LFWPREKPSRDRQLVIGADKNATKTLLGPDKDGGGEKEEDTTRPPLKRPTGENLIRGFKTEIGYGKPDQARMKGAFIHFLAPY